MSQENTAPTTIAPLSTIDLDRLQNGDADETQRLLEACERHGFFYLDLSCDETLAQDWKSLLDLMVRYFNLPLEEKMKHNRSSDTHGYEPVATSTGAVKNLPDYYESLKASRDELLSSDNALAPIIKENHSFFLRLCESVNEVTLTILKRLDSVLNPDSKATFTQYHRKEKSSLSTLSMFRYPKQETLDVGVGHNKHTDLGTLTFLLCEQWGLQVLSDSPSGWQFVAPKPGRAIINVGDTLRFLSGNRLRSAVHRVTPVHELQLYDRFSIAYFLRAEDNAMFKATKDRTVSAKSWHDEKFDVFRQTHDEQARDSVLTGGMEFNEEIVI